MQYEARDFILSITVSPAPGSVQGRWEEPVKYLLNESDIFAQNPLPFNHLKSELFHLPLKALPNLSPTISPMNLPLDLPFPSNTP